MDGMAASENGVWLYDQHLHPSRWLKMRSAKLGEMNTVADRQIASEGFNMTLKVSQFISVYLFIANICVRIFMKVNGYFGYPSKSLIDLVAGQGTSE